jgi:hypothetical protein
MTTPARRGRADLAEEQTMSEQPLPPSTPPTHGPLRRRGLVAAGAALLAALLAKAATRVEAQTAALVLNQQNLSTGATELNYNGTPGTPTLVIRNPAADAIQGLASGSLSYGVLGDNSAGFGVVGTSANGTGVSGGSAGGTGISGDSNTSWGIAGFTDAPSSTPTVGGVYGASTAASSNAYGVWGNATAGIGVRGDSGSSYGVVGTSSTTHAIFGESGSSSAAGVWGRTANYQGVYGQATGSGNGVWGQANGAGAGVLGSSSSGSGVSGSSTSGAGVSGGTTGNHGVFGDANGSGNGVFARTTNGYGIYAQATGTGSAGYFNGNVTVHGNFTVDVGFTKNVAVAFPDGSVRRMYCVESPENWFEDFGGGTLSSGRATVPLDPDFATTIATDNYRVFLTVEGASNGVYVSSKSPTGFTVQEQGNGTSSVPFSYRILGKRKDVVAPRFERIPQQPTPVSTVPPLPAPPVPPTAPATAGGTAGDARPGAPGAAPALPPVQPPHRSPRR